MALNRSDQIAWPRKQNGFRRRASALRAVGKGRVSRPASWMLRRGTACTAPRARPHCCIRTIPTYSSARSTRRSTISTTMLTWTLTVPNGIAFATRRSDSVPESANSR